MPHVRMSKESPFANPFFEPHPVSLIFFANSSSLLLIFIMFFSSEYLLLLPEKDGETVKVETTVVVARFLTPQKTFSFKSRL